jgi:hypothetical protein
LGVGKFIQVDAYHAAEGFVLEIEADRGGLNNQFLNALFQACMMHECSNWALRFVTWNKRSRDYERVVSFFDTLYANCRLAIQ